MIKIIVEDDYEKLLPNKKYDGRLGCLREDEVLPMHYNAVIDRWNLDEEERLFTMVVSISFNELAEYERVGIGGLRE